MLAANPIVICYSLEDRCENTCAYLRGFPLPLSVLIFVIIFFTEIIKAIFGVESDISSAFADETFLIKSLTSGQNGAYMHCHKTRITVSILN